MTTDEDLKQAEALVKILSKRKRQRTQSQRLQQYRKKRCKLVLFSAGLQQRLHRKP